MSLNGGAAGCYDRRKYKCTRYLRQLFFLLLLRDCSCRAGATYESKWRQCDGAKKFPPPRSIFRRRQAARTSVGFARPAAAEAYEAPRRSAAGVDLYCRPDDRTPAANIHCSLSGRAVKTLRPVAGKAHSKHYCNVCRWIDPATSAETLRRPIIEGRRSTNPPYVTMRAVRLRLKRSIN